MTIIDQITSFKISGFSYNGTDTQLNYTAGVSTGVAQASKALVLNSSSNIISGINSLTMTSLITTNLTVNNTVINNSIITNLASLDGVTAGIASASKALIIDASRNINNINNLTASLLTGTINNPSQTNITSLGTLTGLTSNGNLNILQHNGTNLGLMLNSILVTASATELNRLYGILSTTSELNKLSGVTTTTAEFNKLNGLNSTTSELNILSGVTATTNQINFLSSVNAGTASANKALVIDSSRNILNINSLGTTANITTTLGRVEMANTSFGISHKYITGGSSEIITFTDGIDSNYIGTQSNNDFSLAINATRYLTVKKTTGLIGINTLNPNMQLEVNSNSGSCLRLFNSGGNTFLDVAIDNQGLATLVLSGTNPIFSMSHPLRVLGNAASTNTATGALVVTGGAGIGGAVNIGGALSVTGNISGTLATATQPNITSVGTLTSLTSSGVLSITNSTVSTLITNGALVVNGGIGVNNNIRVGREIIYGNGPNYSWSGTSFSGIQMSNTSQILNNSSVAANGTISFVSTNHINQITLTASDTNITTSLAASLYITNAPAAGLNMTISNSYSLVVNEGRTLFNDGTISNNTTSGAVIVNGGVGIGGSVNVGGNLTITGNILGTLLTSNQPNITTLGTLTGLSTNNLTINGTLITATASKINWLDILTAGTAEASKALILDSNRDITNIRNLTVTSVTGAILTPSQPNITSVGNLTIPSSLTITNGVTAISINNTTSSSNYRLTVQSSGGHQDIGSITAHDFSINTNNIRRITTTSSGNVNITSHNLTNTGLQLNGTLITASATEINYLDLTTGPGTAESSKAVILDGSRNASNINTLTLNGTADSIILSSAVSNARTNLKFINDIRSWELGTRGSAAAMPSSFYIWDNNAIAVRFNIDSNGNVGIGTSNQLYKLDVAGDINSSGILRTSVLGNGFTHVNDGVTLVSNVIGTNNIGLFGTSSNHNFGLITSGTERMRIAANGNVSILISTSSSSTTTGALTIVGGVGIGGAINIAGSLKTSSYIQVGTSTDTTRLISLLDNTMIANSMRFLTLGKSNDSGNQAEIAFGWAGNNNDDNYLSLGFHGGERARLTNGGSFAINTTITTYGGSKGRLISLAAGATEWGGVFKNTSNSNNKTIVFYDLNNTEKGSIAFGTGTTAFNTSSDYRLKKDIIPFINGLELVNKLKPVKFKWISSNENAEGFIAHELQEILPNCVTGIKDAMNFDNSINPQSVDYGKLTPVLVSAIKELKQENETLKIQIQNMLSRIIKLEE